MANLKLTDGTVANHPTGPRDVYLWDSEVRRLGVRVTPAGSRIYLVQYRAKGAPGAPSKTRRIILGQHDGKVWTVARARREAIPLLARVDLGGDPFAEDGLKRTFIADAEALAEQEARRRQAEAFSVILDKYVTRKLSRRRSAGEAERLLRAGPAAAWGERPVREIRRSDVAELVESIGERSIATARQTYSELRTFFEWCIGHELLEFSPCERLKAPERPAPRTRVLEDEELRLVWRAAEKLGAPFGPVFKLLILTGQRRAEVAGTCWSELDLVEAVWTIPGARTKNGHAHRVHLSPQALKIIRAAPKVAKVDELFPARGGGAARGFSAVRRRLDREIEALRLADARAAGLEPPEAPLEDWVTHDLRRTCATRMSELGHRPDVIEWVLNHRSGTQSGLLGVYQRYDYWDERKAALVGWGRRVAEILREATPPPSNVHVLKRRA